MPSTSVAEVLATVMPIKSPWLLNTPPPELPGLTAASIWIRFIVVPSLIVIARSSPLTTPTVSVPDRRPSGLPMTLAVSPMRSSLELPMTAYDRFCASIFSSATSVTSSVPTRAASYSVLSASATVIFVAFSMTWLFVTI